MSETETRDDARIEAAARALAGLEPGESWPTNGELGGNLTGTRDDEYRDGLREQARDMLAAADAVDSARAETITVPLTEWRRLHGRMRRDEANDVIERENARLRAVVEAVQALADKAQRHTDEANATYDPITKRYSQLRAIILVDDLRAALAPVSSSGEAESGEADLARAQAKFDSLRAELDVRKARDAVTPRCPTCGSDGGPLQSSKDGSFCPDGFHTPAPVLSGGQADGEGEPVIPIAYQLGALADWCDSQRTSPTTADLRALAAMAASPAARPVLSREALRERLDGHWPTTRSSDLRLVCDCGWNARYGDDVAAEDFTQWRDHLADVLAGGEQRG